MSFSCFLCDRKTPHNINKDSSDIKMNIETNLLEDYVNFVDGWFREQIDLLTQQRNKLHILK